MVFPLIVAGFSAPENLTEVPAPLMENETLLIPISPRLMLPDQLPANLAGPVEAGFRRDSLLVVVAVSDLGFAGCFHF
jgi:hypothetical protein